MQSFFGELHLRFGDVLLINGSLWVTIHTLVTYVKEKPIVDYFIYCIN